MQNPVEHFFTLLLENDMEGILNLVNDDVVFEAQGPTSCYRGNFLNLLCLNFILISFLSAKLCNRYSSTIVNLLSKPLNNFATATQIKLLA